MKFVDGVLAPGVLSGRLYLMDGSMYFQDGDNMSPKRVNLTVGQLEYYTKIQKLKRLEEYTKEKLQAQHA